LRLRLIITHHEINQLLMLIVWGEAAPRRPRRLCSWHFA
jgi:hypothetical protein